MYGIIAQMEETERLERLEKVLRSARIRGEAKCVMCGYCCSKRTCIPTPNELRKIAEFLKLIPNELINKYYAIDRFSDYNYYVKPVGENIKDLTGKFIPSERTFGEGRCIFLTENNLCKIYPVRPRSARKMECWNDTKTGTGAESWTNNKLKKEFGINGKKLEGI